MEVNSGACVHVRQTDALTTGRDKLHRLDRRVVVSLDIRLVVTLRDELQHILKTMTYDRRVLRTKVIRVVLLKTSLSLGTQGWQGWYSQETSLCA
jgi:hypothetical protein